MSANILLQDRHCTNAFPEDDMRMLLKKRQASLKVREVRMNSKGGDEELWTSNKCRRRRRVCFCCRTYLR